MSNSITVEQLAGLVLDAQKTREESFSQELSDVVSEKIKNGGFGDYESCYTIGMREACDKVCEAAGVIDLATPVYLLLECCWNDISDWAATHIIEHALKG